MSVYLCECVSLFCVRGCPLLGLGLGLVIVWLACAAPCREGAHPLLAPSLCSLLLMGWVHFGFRSASPWASGWVLALGGGCLGLPGPVGWRCGPRAHGALGPALDSCCRSWFPGSFAPWPWGLPLLSSGLVQGSNGLPGFALPCSMGAAGCLGLGALPPLLTTIHVKPLPYILHAHTHTCTPTYSVTCSLYSYDVTLWL